MKKILLTIITVGLALMLTGCSLIPGIFGDKTEAVKNQKLTLSLAFGEESGTYSGDLVKDLPQGTGSFTVTDDNEGAWTYQGAWDKGHFKGFGETTWEDGFAQKGNYQDDLLNGQGEESLNGKLLYAGNYTDNRYDGQGILYNYNGEVIYDGDFDMGYYNETANQREARLNPFKAQATEMPYTKIVEEATNKTGEKIKMTGRIYQVYENYENQQYFCDFIMDVNDDPNQMVQVYYRLNTGENPFVEGQMVTVWGTVEYLYTYSSEGGAQNSIPNVEAWSVEGNEG
ncbi:MORN repeat-containing protein [Acetobacterium woodii]|uniref:MORN repeat-containing protein n=1 Tax=Acetobacterium woodii (strain ATCC 29683 / DSM 1030 / JCM 2381 / KCTC 1655 / WB1) TaxID=931626 RepID=H6LI67_ACEWD|nr:hypothetical protein [Acetobacterium woodii]AFA49767.1 hypothetical protein Awo_c30390 [Acetobacterium woodii DSM 1030]